MVSTGATSVPNFCSQWGGWIRLDFGSPIWAKWGDGLKLLEWHLNLWLLPSAQETVPAVLSYFPELVATFLNDLRNDKFNFFGLFLTYPEFSKMADKWMLELNISQRLILSRQLIYLGQMSIEENACQSDKQIFVRSMARHDFIS